MEPIRGIRADVVVLDETSGMNDTLWNRLITPTPFPEHNGDSFMPFLEEISKPDLDAAAVFADWLEDRGDTRAKRVRRKLMYAAFRARATSHTPHISYAGGVSSIWLALFYRTDAETTWQEFAAIDESLANTVRHELALQVLDIFPQTRAYAKAVRYAACLTNSINSFTRVKMREEGIFRQIMPPMMISNDELNRAVATDHPVKVVDTLPEIGSFTRHTLSNARAAIQALPYQQQAVLLNAETMKDVAIWHADEEVGRP